MFNKIFQEKRLKKEALEKAEKTNCELWKAEQKELILEKDPLFNAELLEQVLSQMVFNYIHITFSDKNIKKVTCYIKKVVLKS